MTTFTGPLVPSDVFKITLPGTATVNDAGEVVADLSGDAITPVTLDVSGLATLSGGIRSVLPTYANNAAALLGGLVVNDEYKTATGERRIVV